MLDYYTELKMIDEELRVVRTSSNSFTEEEKTDAIQKLKMRRSTIYKKLAAFNR